MITPSKKHVLLAAGLGFYGDNWEPVVASLATGHAQYGLPHYVCSDHLAELTLAILQKDRAKDAALGYARDVVPMLLRLWPLMKQCGAKFICNAGGLNPEAAGRTVQAALAAKGFTPKIAVVTGDDVMRCLDKTQSTSGLQADLLFANAYLGARPIVDALALGADIVITGRVADAALFLAPLVFEFGWKLEDAKDAVDLNRLAQGIAVGHLLECSGQGSGGNFGSLDAWKSIPDLAHIGYPMAAVTSNGDAVITKADGTGGRVSFDTVRQQLLYEVHDPSAYITPDVVLDMTTLHLEDLDDDRVAVKGATGRERPAQLKVLGGFAAGFKSEVTWGFSWPNTWDKTQAAIEMIRTQLKDKKIPHDELFIEYPGLNSAHGALAPLPSVEALNELNEIYVRIVLKTQSKSAADGFGRLFPWMELSGPAYTCGFSGLHNTSELLGIWTGLIDRDAVIPSVKVSLL
jgi:Acyclic terpene utilisation family protein AtuA